MNNKDICILSMQRVNNMGSVLQAYALMKMLEGIGYNVYFSDIEKKTNLHNSNCSSISFSILLKKMENIDIYFIRRLIVKKKVKKQFIAFDKFRNNELHIDVTKAKYNICVIGSDEVFNCMNNMAEWGFTTRLFGNVEEADKVITYAASCGSTIYDEIPADILNKIKFAFENIYSFSVRDKNTKDFVSKLTSKSISENLDPVLVYNFDAEIQNVELPDAPEKYCIVYSYANRICKKEEIHAIKKLCKSKGMTPVAVGAPQFWIKDYIVCSPFQCLKLFQNAEFVVTDTFHGTIFSMKYAEKFAVFVRANNKNKLLDLISRLQIKQHLINNVNELEDKFYVKKNDVKISEMINNEKNNTLNYLNNSIYLFQYIIGI